MATFAKEADFEAAVIHELRQRGWGDADVIKNPSEANLRRTGSRFFLKTIAAKTGSTRCR